MTNRKFEGRVINLMETEVRTLPNVHFDGNEGNSDE